jgi:NAD dependent epimerase/dehydratase family enzyme
LVGIIDHAIRNESLNGPVNAVAPNPVTNREFTSTLGRVLSKPALFVLPALAARVAFGKMADEVLLASTRVLPTQLKKTGYEYQYPELEGALRHALQMPVQ